MTRKDVLEGWCDWLNAKGQDDMKKSNIQKAIDTLEDEKRVIQMAIDKLIQQTLVERHAKKTKTEDK